MANEENSSESNNSEHLEQTQTTSKAVSNSNGDEVFFASGPFYAHIDEDQLTENDTVQSSKCNVLYTEMPSTSTCTARTDRCKTNNLKKLNLKTLFFGNNSQSHSNESSCDTLCCLLNTGTDCSCPNLTDDDSSSNCKLSDQTNHFDMSKLRKRYIPKTPARKNMQRKLLPNNTMIRVIKPTAIRPEILSDDDQRDLSSNDRPCTSASVYSAPYNGDLMSSNSSAFRQVSTKSHGRSNSLSESFVYRQNTPANTSGQSSIENIYVEPKSPKVCDTSTEPIHMTLEEVRNIAFGAGGSSSNAEHCDTTPEDDIDTLFQHYRSLAKYTSASSSFSNNAQNVQTDRIHNGKSKIKLLIGNILNRTHCIGSNSDNENISSGSKQIYKISGNIKENKQSDLSNPDLKGYRFIKLDSTDDESDGRRSRTPTNIEPSLHSSPFIKRALPPLPSTRNGSSRRKSSQLRSSAPISSSSPIHNLNFEDAPIDTNSQTINSSQTGIPATPVRSMTEEERQKFLDYASSIERVKHCGWYWGPISGEMAEKLLETEPCGSFLVRDSSDEHYIFSLTFKLDGLVRHVRIEHDQGNFSFGSLQKFRSTTIVDFIESAVEHSRSGRFLFFLHRRPVMGPIRVQLLHPVSRFKRVQSLRHHCRFVILRHVRRDQIDRLPLPEYLKKYLDTPYYYSEELANLMDTMNTEGNTVQQLEDEKRKFFGLMDHRTFIQSLLINTDEIQQQLLLKSSHNKRECNQTNEPNNSSSTKKSF